MKVHLETVWDLCTVRKYCGWESGVLREMDVVDGLMEKYEVGVENYLEGVKSPGKV